MMNQELGNRATRLTPPYNERNGEQQRVCGIMAETMSSRSYCQNITPCVEHPNERNGLPALYVEKDSKLYEYREPAPSSGNEEHDDDYCRRQDGFHHPINMVTCPCKCHKEHDGEMQCPRCGKFGIGAHSCHAPRKKEKIRLCWNGLHEIKGENICVKCAPDSTPASSTKEIDPIDMVRESATALGRLEERGRILALLKGLSPTGSTERRMGYLQAISDVVDIISPSVRSL